MEKNFSLIDALKLKGESSIKDAQISQNLEFCQRNFKLRLIVKGNKLIFRHERVFSEKEESEDILKLYLGID
jgi:hypothetical protein